MMKDSDVKRKLETLSREAHELCWPSEIQRIEGAPSPLSFLRDWVTPNRPVIFTRAFDSWPCLKKWNPDYLRSKIGDVEVTVAVTPNGYADAVTDGRFVEPEERTMPFSEFLDVMANPKKHPGVFYVQKQNSNFDSEFAALIEDAALDVPWASEALGKKPDAVNFWMGDGRAVTSMHRDHYENVYLVVSGTKKFILLPPTDVAWVPYGRYPRAKFVSRSDTSDGDFSIVETSEEVPWIAVDPLNPDLDRYPDYSRVHPLEFEVNAGEALYLPSLWFHHVRQSHACVALNFWYDMEFDLKYVYYKFVESLSAFPAGD